MNLDGVGAGTAVLHRAFGEGVVLRIEESATGNRYIHVRFGSNEKSFGFPGAFEDGFLKLKE